MKMFVQFSVQFFSVQVFCPVLYPVLQGVQRICGRLRLML